MNDGVVEGYVNWLGNVCKGDFGDSWFYGVPVTQKFGDVIWYSVVLNCITLFLQVIICIPLGISAAKNQYGKLDNGIMIFAMLCISLPTFFLATVLKYIFAVRLGWFDLYGIVGRYYDQLSDWGKMLDMAKHKFLPVLTLGMLNVGGLTRYTRTNMLEVLNADYIRTARAKGLTERVVILKHALKNALIPVITVVGLQIGLLFGGAILTETVFSWPGVGMHTVTCIRSNDFMSATCNIVMVSILTAVILLAVDMLYAFVDPRIKARYKRG